MNTSEVIAIIGGVIAMLGVAVGVTARLIAARYKFIEAQLKEERRQLKSSIEALENRNSELSRMLLAVKEVGSVALMKLDSINSILRTVKSLLAVEACSVAVPNPMSRTPELIFLALDSPQADSIRRQRVPVDSIGGEVYLKGKPILRNRAGEDTQWYNGVDKATGFKTENLLCLPLFCGGNVVGVLYLINKINGQPFVEADISNAERIVPELASMIVDFAADTRNFDVLGVTPDRPPSEGTVIFCDLSNSRELLRYARPAEAVDRVNEYLSRLIQVGFDFGATVEMSVGGSFMLKFNIIQALEKHALVAVAAGLQMRDAFLELKDRWLKVRLPVENLHCRIGIESGPLHNALLGHPHNLQSAVLGDPVEVARCLCDFADRSKDVIAIGETTFASVRDWVIVKNVPQGNLGPARYLITQAYEVVRLQEGVIDVRTDTAQPNRRL